MNNNNYQRKLLIVPILHTKEDMGTFGSHLPVKDGYFAFTSQFWNEVKEKVKRQVNGAQSVKVYQDGLPNTKKELVEKIINDVKSPNYQLLRFLKAMGAQIFGTEDPELLKEEYEFVSKILQAKDEANKSKAREAYENQAGSLLAQRDEYMAKRIDKSLNNGDLGILFIGAAHEIKSKLPKDIQVEIL